MATNALERIDMTMGEVMSIVEFSMPDYLASVNTEAALRTQQQLAAAYDKACTALIGPNDVQMDGNRSFKKKSAWRKLARHFGISTAVSGITKEDMNGIFVATVTVRASGPWGQSAEAVGACGTDEATGRRVITIADAIATAETRSTNRAISNLIAMGEVSAEEIHEKAPHENSDTARTADEPACPKCQGRMYDNRLSKKNPKAPDYKCQRSACGGVIWPTKQFPEQEDAFPSEHDVGYLNALAEGA